MEISKYDIPKIYLMGIPIHNITMAVLLDICEYAILEKRNIVLGMVNVAKLVNSRKDLELNKSLKNTDITVADGQGIVWLSHFIGHPLRERVAGISIMYGLMERAAQKKYRIFFLGAKQEVVQKVVQKTRILYPGVQVAGYHDGYFDLEKDGAMVAEQIRDSYADILFIAITPPKKEIFMDRWKHYFNVSICHGVGGSFDIFAGLVKRAPCWMQNAGLEWFYRILQEPKRMWKRYLVTNTIFFFLSVGEIVRYRFGKKRHI